MEVKSLPRRLPPAVRRDQLIDAALEIAARHGYENLAFEKVANRAGVTRNLVYHYFPGGRQELLEAAVHRAGEQLSSGWITSADVPLGERLAANLNRMMDHAAEPTDAWQLYRQGRGSVDPTLLQIAALYREQVIGNISLNQLGTSEPPPVVRVALDGFLSYVETVIESALQDNLPREQVIELVGGTLMAAMNAAAGASVGGPKPR
ncbi:MAG TPA: TetR/AcrR family transcriptional regulator [Solirubrobacterales bacterium]|jgi:AcrR family transcriptional regulator|nr:TetR/AcrR family transcriptional regulator [Solirubrobacterales bacterium]